VHLQAGEAQDEEKVAGTSKSMVYYSQLYVDEDACKINKSTLFLVKINGASFQRHPPDVEDRVAGFAKQIVMFLSFQIASRYLRR